MKFIRDIIEQKGAVAEAAPRDVYPLEKEQLVSDLADMSPSAMRAAPQPVEAAPERPAPEEYEDDDAQDTFAEPRSSALRGILTEDEEPWTDDEPDEAGAADEEASSEFERDEDDRSFDDLLGAYRKHDRSKDSAGPAWDDAEDDTPDAPAEVAPAPSGGLRLGRGAATVQAERDRPTSRNPAWSYDDGDEEEELSTPDLPAPEPAPAPQAKQGRASAGRAKTRLLGFSGLDSEDDPFAKAASSESNAMTKFPVGWLVVVDGPGRGAAFSLHNGVAQIGRGEGQSIRLDFGDTSISRENHAAIAFDEEQNSFFIGHGGKANLVRCNSKPVLSTQELGPGDTIRIGETTLRFVPLCGPDFKWSA